MICGSDEDPFAEGHPKQKDHARFAAQESYRAQHRASEEDFHFLYLDKHFAILDKPGCLRGRVKRPSATRFQRPLTRVQVMRGL